MLVDILRARHALLPNPHEAVEYQGEQIMPTAILVTSMEAMIFVTISRSFRLPPTCAINVVKCDARHQAAHFGTKWPAHLALEPLSSSVY